MEVNRVATDLAVLNVGLFLYRTIDKGLEEFRAIRALYFSRLKHGLVTVGTAIRF